LNTQNIEAQTVPQAFVPKSEDAYKIVISIAKEIGGKLNFIDRAFVNNSILHVQMRKLIILSENQNYVRDGNHFCSLIGVPHSPKGSDFAVIGIEGDAKFLRDKSPVCMGGEVNIKTVEEQGKRILIAYHSRKDAHHITSGAYLTIWDSVRGSFEEAQNLISEYNEWVTCGREGNPDFSSENFYIKLKNRNDDRFYIRASVVSTHQKVFFINNECETRTPEQIKIDRFLDAESVVMQMHGIKIHKEIRLSDMIEMAMKIPYYQREWYDNEKFALALLTETIFAGISVYRGMFMFHCVSEDGKDVFYIADGQQRWRAIERFFVKRDLRLKECFVPFNGKLLDFSNMNWTEILETSELVPIVKEFVEFVMNSKFLVREYHNHSHLSMSLEYRIANSGAQFNRQETRACFNSQLGMLVQFMTQKDVEIQKLNPAYKELIKLKLNRFDDTVLATKKGALKDVNLSIKRMNIDSILSFGYNRMNSWGPGFRESEDKMDDLYEASNDLNLAAENWKLLEEYLLLINSAIEFYNNNKSKKYPAYKKKDRRLRAKGYAIADKEEWDLIMFLILELKRRHTGKKLTITADVISKIVNHHYPMTVPPEKVAVVKEAVDSESDYGHTTRMGQRDYTEIKSKWFPSWEDYLLGLDLTELEKFGFKFV
jgi:hypothetical protein